MYASTLYWSRRWRRTSFKGQLHGIPQWSKERRNPEHVILSQECMLFWLHYYICISSEETEWHSHTGPIRVNTSPRLTWQSNWCQNGNLNQVYIKYQINVKSPPVIFVRIYRSSQEGFFCVSDGVGKQHEWLRCSFSFLYFLWHNFLDRKIFIFTSRICLHVIISAHFNWELGHFNEAIAFSVFLPKLIHIFLGLVQCLILFPVTLFVGQTPN